MSDPRLFIAAALAGLSAQNRQHDPEKIALAAVEIGEAVARLLGGERVYEVNPETARAPLTDDGLRALVREMVEEALEEALTQPPPSPEG